MTHRYLSLALVILLAAVLSACSTDEDASTLSAGPTVTIAGAEDGAVLPPSDVVVITVTADRLTELSLRIGDVVDEDLPLRERTEYPLSALTAGEYELVVTATDDRGRQALQSWSFEIDPTATGTDDDVDGPGATPPPAAQEGEGLDITWLSPSSTRRVAGDVPLAVEVDGDHGGYEISLWYQASSGDPQRIASGTGASLETTWSTMLKEPGEYTLLARVEDADGHVATSSIDVVVESAIVIMNPLDEDTVGPSEDRQQVDVTVGLAGTLQADAEVVQVEVLIGAVADGRIAATATDTQGGATFVYSWDTCIESDGHDPTIVGDRTLTARVTLEDETTLLSPGVGVTYMGCF